MGKLKCKHAVKYKYYSIPIGIPYLLELLKNEMHEMTCVTLKL